MERIYSILRGAPTAYNSIMLWAACCMEFFGFLRVSELTAPSLTQYDPEVHLSLADVALDSHHSPSKVWLFIKQSKTDPFCQGVRLCLGKTDSSLCPVKALLPYLAARGAIPGPLFICKGGNVPLSQQLFRSLLSDVLKQSGLDDTLYNTHSFRIGAATSAKEAGISDTDIKMMGRWKSEAYQLYIRKTPESLANLSCVLVSHSSDQ